MLRPAVPCTDSPPTPIQDVELAEYVKGLRRRIEVDFDQITALAKEVYELKGENARLKFEVDKLSLDLNIQNNPNTSPQWKTVST